MVATSEKVNTQLVPISKNNKIVGRDEMIASAHTTITAIIPAYNEAKRIGAVISAVLHETRISRLVVVNDGSTDKTDEVLAYYAGLDERIHVIHHLKNKGKGDALRSGMLVCPNDDVFLMLDADLLGIQPEHIVSLVAPVLNGTADMTLGLFVHGKWNTDLSHWLTPWLTGQRCFRAELLNYLDWSAAQGYGLETALTLTAKSLHWRVSRVLLDGVSHPPSEFHRGLVHGILNRITMYWQIVRASWIFLQKGLRS